MARFNEVLAGRYNRFLQKFLSMKGGPPAPQLASELSATWAMFHGRENRYLEDWKTFGGRVFVAAVAAQDGVVRLNNPKVSTSVAVVESLKFSLGAAVSEAFVEYANADPGPLAGVVTPANFDNRTNPPGNGSNGAQCGLSGANNIAQGAHFLFDDIVFSAQTTSPELIVHEDQEITLLPNSSIQVRTSTLNVTLVVTIRWRERPLEDSEKT